MPAPGRTPVLSFPLYTVIILAVIAPFALAYDRFKIWRHQRRTR